MAKQHRIPPLLTGVVLALLLGAVALSVSPGPVAAQDGTSAQAGDAGFNYAEALQLSILFYEAQRSGDLTGSAIPTRLPWRGDAQMNDGADQGVDLVGGWVDAGDNMKYGFPMAAAVTMLAWGGVEYRAGFEASGQLTWFLNQLRWANDYFLKAHTAPNELWGQVGLTGDDHSRWVPIEVTHLTNDRSAFKIDATCPGSDLAAETAAALAASSLVFRPTDPAYADELLAHAVELYDFADAFRGTYTACITDAAGPYNSWSGYDDELVWGALWVHRALEAAAPGSGQDYLDKAVAGYGAIAGGVGWTQNWDDKRYGAYILMAQTFPDETRYQADAERWLDWWMRPEDGGGVTYTPAGFARLDNWGAFRYAMNTALGAFIYADWTGDAERAQRYTAFAEAQINYILGQNPLGMSYVIGFGDSYPQNPHHRTAHNSPQANITTPAQSRHILYGGLVGSPNPDDTYSDDRQSYEATEVAVDYNAGLVGVLARMALTYGGDPIPDDAFPLPDTPYTCRDEFPVFAEVAQGGEPGTTRLSLVPDNRSGWPTRVSDSLKVRYFFTLDAGDPGDLRVELNTSAPITVTGPEVWDADAGLYAVTVDYTGLNLYIGMPQGDIPYADLVLGGPGWDASNDWSLQDFDAGYPGGRGNRWAYAPNIAVYEGEDETLICGVEPITG